MGAREIVGRFGISGKIALLAALIALASVVPVTFMAYRDYAATREADFAALKSGLEGRIGVSFVQPVWTFNQNALSRLVESELLAREVQGIRVRDRANSVLVWKAKAGPGRSSASSSPPAGTGYDTLEIPLVMEDRGALDRIASVTVWLDSGILRSELHGFMTYRMVGFAFVATLLAAALFAILAIKLALPLDQVIEGIKKVDRSLSNGEWQHPRLEERKGSFGELRFMVGELNQMLAALEKATASLRGMNGELEERVRERTRAEEALCKLNEELDQRVRQRTAELAEKNNELERFNRLFVGRELRMMELKEKIKELEGEMEKSGG